MFLDKFSRWIDESIAYNSIGQGGASPQLLKSLKGFTAVDTPIGSGVIDGSPIGQMTEQAEWTLLQRNLIFDGIDSIADFHISETIKNVIISDGFCDLNGGYAMSFKYVDEEHKDRAERYTKDIENFLRRTRVIDILKDCVANEGMNYGEVFLSTPVECGRGITEVTDNLDIKELLAIYKNTELVGAVKFNLERNRARGVGFLPAKEISHFMLNYEKKPIRISKTFTDKYNIAEKIRVAKPILSSVVDLIQQYRALEQLQTALELIKATQGVYLGIGISPQQDQERIAKQLQEFTLKFNRNRTAVINNLSNIDITSLLSTMNKLEFVPYSVEEGTNNVRQIDVKYAENKLSDILNNIRKTIALAVGIPDQNLSIIDNGMKTTKEDNIENNPMYSRMLSRIQQLLAKGLRDMFYKHLRYLYSNEQGLCQRIIEKDRIEILFNATTNLNDRLEDESLLLKAETVGNMLNVIENLASSAYIPIKVKGELIIEYWKKQMYKDVYLRDCIEMMTEEEQKKMMMLNGGDDGAPDIAGAEDDIPDEVDDTDKAEVDEEPEEKEEKEEKTEEETVETEETKETEKGKEKTKKISTKKKSSGDLRDIFK